MKRIISSSWDSVRETWAEADRVDRGFILVMAATLIIDVSASVDTWANGVDAQLLALSTGVLLVFLGLRLFLSFDNVGRLLLDLIVAGEAIYVIACIATMLRNL